MALIKVAVVDKWWGDSSDTKPTSSPPPAGSEFNEADTRDKYVFTGSAWVKQVKNYRSRMPAEERR